MHLFCSTTYQEYLRRKLIHSQDLDKEDDTPEGYQQVPVEEVFAIKKKEQEERKRKDKARLEKLRTYGFEGEHGVEAIL